MHVHTAQYFIIENVKHPLQLNGDAFVFFCPPNKMSHFNYDFSKLLTLSRFDDRFHNGCATLIICPPGFELIQDVTN